MDRYEDLASEIIDDVSDLIEEHYKIKPKHITDDKSIEHPALINGIVYFNLEAEIAGKIKKLVKKLSKER